MSTSALARYTPVCLEPPYVWQVASFSHPGDHYLVDLSHFRGNGECMCRDFVCTKGDKLKAGAFPGPKYRCVHIEAARSVFMDHVLSDLMGRDAVKYGIPAPSEDARCETAGLADWPAKPGFNC